MTPSRRGSWLYSMDLCQLLYDLLTYRDCRLECIGGIDLFVLFTFRQKSSRNDPLCRTEMSADILIDSLSVVITKQ